MAWVGLKVIWILSLMFSQGFHWSTWKNCYKVKSISGISIYIFGTYLTYAINNGCKILCPFHILIKLSITVWKSLVELKFTLRKKNSLMLIDATLPLQVLNMYTKIHFPYNWVLLKGMNLPCRNMFYQFKSFKNENTKYKKENWTKVKKEI